MISHDKNVRSKWLPQNNTVNILRTGKPLQFLNAKTNTAINDVPNKVLDQVWPMSMETQQATAQRALHNIVIIMYQVWSQVKTLWAGKATFPHHTNSQ